MAPPAAYASSTAAFFGGVKSALSSVFFPVIGGTYVGIGALAVTWADGIGFGVIVGAVLAFAGTLILLFAARAALRAV